MDIGKFDPAQTAGDFFQGHPEYDTHSLLKEYKREVLRFLTGERADEPPYPDNYFSPEAAALALEAFALVERCGHWAAWLALYFGRFLAHGPVN